MVFPFEQFFSLNATGSEIIQSDFKVIFLFLFVLYLASNSTGQGWLFLLIELLRTLYDNESPIFLYSAGDNKIVN
jgi:hypothetical protein